MKEFVERLRLLRAKIAERGIDGLIVRGTDRFLNEYVPNEESTRVWLTGFTGSTGDALITKDTAHLFVDGRYYLQADQETDPALWTVVKVPMGTSLQAALADMIIRLFGNGTFRIGIETDRYSVTGFQELKEKTEAVSVIYVPFVPSMIEEIRGHLTEVRGRIWGVDESLTGCTVREKLAVVQDKMAVAHLDAFVIQRLDEIAYLTNLRGDEIPFQATLKSLVVVTQGECWVALPGGMSRTVIDPAPELRFVDEKEWLDLLKGREGPLRVGFDPASTTEWTRLTLESAGATAVAVASPLTPMKAKKTSAELAHMIHAFERADGVVSRAQRWLCREVGRGNRITEADFADKVYQLFKRSGASGLSFKVISAAGQNGAVIHYSIPSPDRVIQAGELMLLDTGAYYEGGYATDLTRTFLVGGRGTRASDEQRRIFTLVLKGATAGMRARFPVGTHGVSIDALVRSPLWAAGYNYNHGTGHGVGINVHESPPNIASQGSYILEKGHVFSIEPGIYLPGFGGVRIENLCTVVDDSEREGWLAIVPLTFSPLDDRLIDRRLLTREERVWLKWFKREGRIKHSGPPAVPLLS